jgi:hypothetical protein
LSTSTTRKEEKLKSISIHHQIESISSEWMNNDVMSTWLCPKLKDFSMSHGWQQLPQPDESDLQYASPQLLTLRGLSILAYHDSNKLARSSPNDSARRPRYPPQSLSVEIEPVGGMKSRLSSLQLVFLFSSFVIYYCQFASYLHRNP